MKKSTVNHFSMSFKPMLGDKRCHISVTEWVNGCGYDITIDDKPVMSLADEEWRALNICLNAMHMEDIGQ